MSLCPYGVRVYCHRGYPSNDPDVPGEERCEAWVSRYIIPFLCQTTICDNGIMLSTGQYTHVRPCYDNGYCPYEGCGRHRQIEKIERKYESDYHKYVYERQNKKQVEKKE